MREQVKWMVRLVLASGLMALVQPLWAQAQVQPQAQGQTQAQGHLVSAAWLQQQLGQTDLRVLDASSARQYREGHIPGAINADFMGFGPTGVTPQQMQRQLRSWGISAGQRIVIVDQGGTYQAPRLFWDLAYHGVPTAQLFILNGGIAQWRAAGGALTTQATPAPPAGSISLGATQDTLRVKLPEFLAATAEPRKHVMLEALDPDYYYGGAGFFNRYGHVPHATLMPADDYFNADKTFKSPAEIQRMLDHLGIGRQQQVHTYCGGGGAAAVPWFALKYLLGYPRVSLFLESQLGWLQDERELPVWTTSAPQLLRDTSWLKAWGSPMARMFKLAQVSIVDVRAPQAYQLGHVPLAVNVPAAAFGRQLSTSAHSSQASDSAPGLAALLSQAGVRAGDEAVLVSDGGLTPDAALAFLALENLGQARVSIFTDSLDRWVDRGQQVARPAAAKTRAAGGGDVASGPPTGSTPGYQAQPRPGLLLTDAAAAPALFPRVYVASGAQMPTSLPTGTVVHLPYTQLLQADGMPRPAHDIWLALQKAGVPRYAEVVLFADAPGEAAINYVLLRLMGFADVKVWLR